MYFYYLDAWFVQDRETFFSEALQKWIQLNCTSDFVSFEREVRNKVDSLAQLVYHKVSTCCMCPGIHMIVQCTYIYYDIYIIIIYVKTYVYQVTWLVKILTHICCACRSNLWWTPLIMKSLMITCMCRYETTTLMNLIHICFAIRILQYYNCMHWLFRMILFLSWRIAC